MKKICLLIFSFLSIVTFAQTDTKAVEPNQETSYENQELLIVALIGLVLLLLLYFFFRRTRR